jgi:hypothetical protein
MVVILTAIARNVMLKNKEPIMLREKRSKKLISGFDVFRD